MFRGVGDEEGHELVPLEFLEIEVEADIVMPSADFKEDPHLPATFMAPFKTGNEFGQWLYNVLVAEDGTSSTFQIMHALFANYILAPKTSALRRLIGYGRHVFTTIHRIYFLEGLLIIVEPENQKLYVSRIHRENLAMLWRNDLSKQENIL